MLFGWWASRYLHLTDSSQVSHAQCLQQRAAIILGQHSVLCKPAILQQQALPRQKHMMGGT